MRLLFDPGTMQYIVDFGAGGVVAASIEDLKSNQLPSEQTLRTVYYFSSVYRGHSHAPGNGCRYCGFYNGVRERTQPCPYSEF